MNYSTAVMLINPNIRAVYGRYDENGPIETFKTIDPNLAIDDLAIVESSTRWKITTVKIVAIDVEVDFDSPNQLKWVVGKIDLKGHDEINKMEAAAIDLIKKGELRKRREDIKKNTLDAFSAGEIDRLDIVKLGSAAIEDASKKVA